MKTSVIAACFLACSAVLLGDIVSSTALRSNPAPVLEELVRMTRAGSSDVSVLAYAKAHRLELPPEVSEADLSWLRESGVSPRVVSYMSAIDVRAPEGQPQYETGSASAQYAVAPPAESQSQEGEQESVPVSPSGEYANGWSEAPSDTYADASYDGYPDFYSAYPWYDYGPYPYAFFYIANPFFFADFHGHHGHHHGDHVDHHGDHHGGSHGGHDGSIARGEASQGRSTGGVARAGFNEAWRQRTPTRDGLASFASSRGQARTVFARRGPGVSPRGVSPRGASVVWRGRNGFGGPARGPSPRGFQSRMQSPRSVTRSGGFGRPGFSASPRFSRGFSGGSRVSGGFSGGSHVGGAAPAGRGRR